MIARIKEHRLRRSVPPWHAIFLKMAPAIETHARIAFRHLRPAERAEAVQDVLCYACTAIARLDELNKLELAYPSVLARFGVAQVRDGRKVGCHRNIQDVLSPYCQRRKDLAVESLDRFNEKENAWEEAVVQDTRTTPVPEIVSFRIDFADWLGDLPRRNRKIAEILSLGHSTGETAKRFNVSPGRISQLRRDLHDSWCEFQGEQSAPDSTALANI